MEEQAAPTFLEQAQASLAQLWAYFETFQAPAALSWMNWTVPTAVFFVSIALMLLTMTALELVWPTVERKGFLPMTTTRGDRLFLSLLAAAFIHLGFVAFSDLPLWYASVASLILFVVTMWRG